MPVNLHALARRAVSRLHPEETVTLYQSAGQINVKGALTPIYDAPAQVSAQIQSISDDALTHADRTGMNSHTRKAWFFQLPKPITTVDRATGRGGDVIQRSDGTWWLVDALSEDFTASGWVSVRLTWQVKAPDFSASPWWKGNP